MGCTVLYMPYKTRPDFVRKRIRADISQKEIAAELGIGDRSVWEFENGGTLAKERTLLDYLEAIETIKARRSQSTQKAS